MSRPKFTEMNVEHRYGRMSREHRSAQTQVRREGPAGVQGLVLPANAAGVANGAAAGSQIHTEKKSEGPKIATTLLKQDPNSKVVSRQWRNGHVGSGRD